MEQTKLLSIEISFGSVRVSIFPAKMNKLELVSLPKKRNESIRKVCTCKMYFFRKPNKLDF